MTITCQACFAEGPQLRCSLCQHARYCSQECQQQNPYHTSCRKSASSALNAYQSVINSSGSLVQALQVGASISDIRQALKYLKSNTSELRALFKSLTLAQYTKPHQFLSQLNEFGIAMVQFDAYTVVDFPLLSRQFGIRSEFETKGLATYRERFRSVAHTLRIFMHRFWPILRPNSSQSGRLLLLQIRNVLEELLQGDALLRSTDLINLSVIRTLNKLVKFIRDALLDPLADTFSTLFSWLGRYLSASLTVESVHSPKARNENVHLGLFGTELYLEAFPSKLVGPKVEGDKAMFQLWLGGFRTALRTHGDSGRAVAEILEEPLLKEKPEFFSISTGQLADLLDEPDLRFFSESLLLSFLCGVSMVDTCRAIHKLTLARHHNLADDPELRQVQADVAQVVSVAESFQHPLLDELRVVTARFNQTLSIVKNELTERLSTVNRATSEFREQQWSIVGQIAHHLASEEPITSDGTGVLDICLGKPMAMLASEYMRMIQLTYDIEYDLTDDYYDYLLDSDDDDDDNNTDVEPREQPTRVAVGPIVEVEPRSRGRSPRRPLSQQLLQQQNNIVNNVVNNYAAAPAGNEVQPAEMANSQRSRSMDRYHKKKEKGKQKKRTLTSIACDFLWQGPVKMGLKFVATITLITAATYGLPNLAIFGNTDVCTDALAECQMQTDRLFDDISLLNARLQDPLRLYTLFPEPEIAPKVLLDQFNSYGSKERFPNGAPYDRNFLNSAYELDMEKVNAVIDASLMPDRDAAVRIVRDMTVNPASLINLEGVNIQTRFEGSVIGLAEFIGRSGQRDWDDDMCWRLRHQTENIEPGSETAQDRRLQEICGIVRVSKTADAKFKLVGVIEVPDQPGIEWTTKFGERKLSSESSTAPSPPSRAIPTINPTLNLLNDTHLPSVPPEVRKAYERGLGGVHSPSLGERIAEAELPLMIMLLYVALILLPWYWFVSSNPNATRYVQQLRGAWIYTLAWTVATVVPRHLSFMDVATMTAGNLASGASMSDTFWGSYVWNLGSSVVGATWSALGTSHTWGMAPLMMASAGPSYHMAEEIIGGVLNTFRGQAGPANTIAAITQSVAPTAVPAQAQAFQMQMRSLEDSNRLLAGELRQIRMGSQQQQQYRAIPTYVPPASALVPYDAQRSGHDVDKLVRSYPRNTFPMLQPSYPPRGYVQPPPQRPSIFSEPM